VHEKASEAEDMGMDEAGAGEGAIEMGKFFEKHL